MHLCKLLYRQFVFILNAKTRSFNLSLRLCLFGERNEIIRLYNNGFKNLEERVKALHTEVSVKSQLKGIADIISLKYVAKKYFGKTSSWLYNKINMAVVNGKPAHFYIRRNTYTQQRFARH